MTSDAGKPLTPDQIQNAAVILKKIRPDYSPIIDFYGQVFSAQAEALSDLCPEPLVIEAEILELKKANDMPLIAPSQFPVNKEAAKALMARVADLAVAHAPKLARAGKIIRESLDTIDLSALFDHLLNNRDISSMAKPLGIAPEALGFFGYNAMFPSIQACATQLAAYLSPNHDHNKGYCPICGTQPDLAHLDQDGKKWLTCSLCSHTWKVKRMGCLFCDTQDETGQHYFFSQDEKEYRVYYCRHCKTYLKTVDTRELSRAFVPRLEQVATLHLDIRAKEDGYLMIRNTGH